MIKQASIENVKKVADIVSVIMDNGVLLKKKGVNHVSCCPFHNEKSGSFMVSQTKQSYKCFGCGKSGDSIAFLQEKRGFSFAEAIEWLAHKYSIALEYENDTEEAKKQRDEKSMALDFMGEVKLMYHKLLMENEDAKNYLIKERKLTIETIQEWQIGYAPANWRTITDYAIRTSKWDLAIKCGVCVVDGEKNRDFFYDRIIFPIHDERGRTISFGGRIWHEDQKKDAKYMNGKATEFYKKDEVWYGLHMAMSEINKSKEAIVVEGYMDVVSAHQNGVKNTIASCGTALNNNQAKALLKRAEIISIAGDNDEAGIISMLKSIDVFYMEGAKQVNVIQMPEGVKDLDQLFNQK